LWVFPDGNICQSFFQPLMPSRVSYEIVNCRPDSSTLSVEADYICYGLWGLILLSWHRDHQLSLRLMLSPTCIFRHLLLLAIIMLILMHLEDDILGADSPGIDDFN